MTILDIWAKCYDAFEACAADDQWDRLRPFLTNDAQYRVAGVPFACTVKGADAIIAGFARSFAGFDRKFDRRTHMVVGTRLHEPNLLEMDIWGIYEKAGLPKLAFPALGQVHFDGERIGLMVDIYDATRLEAAAALQWMGMHGLAVGGLDPRYAA